MESEKIARINALARKSRTEGLNPEEKAEQLSLRTEYIRAFRANMEETLKRVRVEQEDGTYMPLEKRQ